MSTPRLTPQDPLQSTPLVTPLVAKMQRLLQAKPGLKDRAHFRKTYLNPTIQAGSVESALLGKPCSRFQRYRLTPVGQAALACVVEASTPHVDSPATLPRSPQVNPLVTPLVAQLQRLL